MSRVGQVKGRIIADRYRLHEVIGGGGAAEVYRASDRVLHREVAVKLLRDDADDEAARERFVTEARLLAGLAHPNLVTLFDAGVETTTPYLVMELVDGPSLDRILSGGPLAGAEVRAVAAQLADALAYAHAAGVVHRDVKPGNVLRGADDRARLADFGIARLLGDAMRHTLTGQTIGTAAYLSPEQVRGEDVTSATDVYSLGLVLIEALTGERAYQGSTAESAVARLNRAPGIPGDIDASFAGVLTAMTHIDPAQRPSAAQVQVGLARPDVGAEPDHAPTAVLATTPMTSATEERSLARSHPHSFVDQAGEAIERAARQGVERLRRLPRHQQGVLFAVLAVLAFLLVVAVASGNDAAAPPAPPPDQGTTTEGPTQEAPTEDTTTKGPAEEEPDAGPGSDEDKGDKAKPGNGGKGNDKQGGNGKGRGRD